MSIVEFQDTADNLTEELLTSLSIGGPPVHINIHGKSVPLSQEDLQGAYFVAVGLGRYAISMTDPSVGARFLVDGDRPSKAYIIDLRNGANVPSGIPEEEALPELS